MRRNSFRHRADYRLYLVTDTGMTGPDRLQQTVQKAVDGGVTMVQYREKKASTSEMIRQATALRKILDSSGTPLIINDRVDVALASGAHGVHVGQQDMDPETVRALMGEDALIGYSVETMQQADQIDELDIDYVGVSPIYSTPTKTDTGAPWGVDGLHALRQSTLKPLVAIGGLNEKTIPETLRAGADGIAVVSAICAAKDPRRSASMLFSLVSKELPGPQSDRN